MRLVVSIENGVSGDEVMELLNDLGLNETIFVPGLASPSPVTTLSAAFRPEMVCLPGKKEPPIQYNLLGCPTEI